MRMPATTGSIEDEQKWDKTVSKCFGRAIFQFRRVITLYIAVATPRFLRIIDKALTADMNLEIFVIETGHFGVALT